MCVSFAQLWTCDSFHNGIEVCWEWGCVHVYISLSLLIMTSPLLPLLSLIQETGDVLILVNYVSMFAINSIILLQFFIYWNATPTSKGEGHSKKEI